MVYDIFIEFFSTFLLGLHTVDELQKTATISTNCTAKAADQSTNRCNKFHQLANQYIKALKITVTTLDCSKLQYKANVTALNLTELHRNLT